MLSNAVKESLIPDTEFWSSSKTLLTLAEGDYFKKGDNVAYPAILKQFLGSGEYYFKSAQLVLPYHKNETINHVNKILIESS